MSRRLAPAPVSTYAAVLLCCSFTAASALTERIAPAGTELEVRLKAPISSNSSKPKDAVEAVVISPVLVGGEVVIPAGAVIRGKVTEVKPSIKPDERATLGLDFSEILGHGGKAIPLKARLVDVENARESIDNSGQIVGILASETIAAKIEQGIGKVAHRSPGLADMLEIAKGAVLKQAPTGEIRYEPGVEMRVRLLEAARVSDTLPGGSDLAPVQDEEALYSLSNRQPFQTVAEKPPKPSDITNLLFVGTDEQLKRAFEAAGWSPAHEANAGSILETVAAIAEVRGYKEAPMSKLLLEGKRSDFEFQKGNNTFAKRHHLRIWRRPDTFQGKPVWVCAATHDIGIDFSEENRTFIHRIDPQIDRERAKVVSDLLFTKMVQSLALVDRPSVPRKSENATGDAIQTDGRIAAVILR